MKVTTTDELQCLYGDDIHREATELVEHAIQSIVPTFFKRDDDFRLLVYSELIAQACGLLFHDGGPVAALCILKHATADMRSEAKERAKTMIGPFITEGSLETLAMYPAMLPAAMAR